MSLLHALGVAALVLRVILPTDSTSDEPAGAVVVHQLAVAIDALARAPRLAELPAPRSELNCLLLIALSAALRRGRGRGGTWNDGDAGGSCRGPACLPLCLPPFVGGFFGPPFALASGLSPAPEPAQVNACCADACAFLFSVAWGKIFFPKLAFWL